MIPLATSGGNHPPSAYADACARTIFDIDPAIPVDRRPAAQDLQSKFTQILLPHFAEVIEREANNLANFVDHCDRTLEDVLPTAEEAVWTLQKAAIGTPWEAKLLDCEWFLAALNTVASHLATAVNVERLWFADRNPNNASAAAYKRRYHGV